MIAAENAGKLTCKWLRNMNHKIQATKKNALMHETTRVSIRVKPKKCTASTFLLSGVYAHKYINMGMDNMETIWVHQLNRSSSDLPINNVDKIILFVY
jgi:hypothetical protein